MSLPLIRRKVSDLFPLAVDGLREFMRQEVIPVLKEARERYNDFATSLATGPFDFGVIQCGTGVPVAAPSASRAIYIRLDGGALTTLYVWEGGAWAPK
jgi:hypothetical protein